MNYKVGALITLGKKDVKYQLLNYRGEYRRLADGVRVFPVPKSQITEDGREHAYFEVWECLNLDTGKMESKKLPIYVYQEATDEYVNKDRRDVINDLHEVTSLLDSYESWQTGDRTGVNFHLNIINQRHLKQIERLREMETWKIDDDLRVGIRLKLIQKENPNSVTLRRLKEWSQQFPLLLTKIKHYVYQEYYDHFNSDNIGDLPTEIREQQ